MVKRRPKRKPRQRWAPKQEPDQLPEPLPPLDDPSYPFLKLADDNPILDRIWLGPEREAEPSLGRWIVAFVAVDQRKDQAPLSALFKSDHPLQRYAGRHLANFIDRYQERDALMPLLAKLQSGAELLCDDRLMLVDMLERQPWTKTTGNRPISYEVRPENAVLGRASAEVLDLKNQGKDLKERLDERMAQGMSLKQALDKVKNRKWRIKDVTLKERVAELRSQDPNPQRIKDKLVSEGWVRNNETIEQALAELPSNKSALNMALDKLHRQREWTSQETAPEITVKQAVDELKVSEGRSLAEAVARLISQRWTTDEAAARVSKWWGIPRKTLRDFCEKGRKQLRQNK